jgi:hypothetical protein
MQQVQSRQAKVLEGKTYWLIVAAVVLAEVPGIAYH